MKSPVFARRPTDRRDRQRGAALVELAVLITLLAIVVFGTVDFGRIAYHAMAVTNAARAGAMHGAQPGNSDDYAGMQAAALSSAAPDIGVIVASASRSCECQIGTATPTVMTTCPPPGVPPCAGTVRMRVKVIASKTFTTMTSVPGVPKTVVVSRTAIMRAQ